MADAVLVLPWGQPSSAVPVIEHLRGLGLDPTVRWPTDAPAAAADDDEAPNTDESECYVLGILGAPEREAARKRRQRQDRGNDHDAAGYLDQMQAVVSDRGTVGGAMLVEEPHPLPNQVGPLVVARLDSDGAWRTTLTDGLQQARFLIAGRELRRRAAKALDELGRGLFEREEVIRLSLLSALAGESIFLLGPPGVAKSLIARRLKHVFAPGARSFEYLMNRFSTPDELFGPVSIEGLKRGELKRLTRSYLPDATVVFLDEIWKAGPSIQNALLTVLNEKIFRNGGRDEQVKLRALLSASNELPAAGQGLGALWDRFLVRLHVDNVTNPRSRHELIRSAADLNVPQLEVADRFLDRELAAIDRAIDRVPIPDPALAVIDGVIEAIKGHNERVKDERHRGDHGDPGFAREAGTDFDDEEDEEGEHGEGSEIYVSDRRWKKIGRLLRASALLNGRQAVDLIDCFLIAYCIWNVRGQMKLTREMVEQSIKKISESSDLADMQGESAALHEGFDRLPRASSRTPRLLRGHYRIDLQSDRDKELLTERATGRTFNWLAKAERGRLGRESGVVHLTAPGGGGRRAAKVELSGRQGGSPLVIVLENRADSGPLPAFGATPFHLIADDRRVTALDLDRPDARSFAARLNAFRRRLAAVRADLAERKQRLPDQVAGHLFLSLSPEQVIDLGDSLGAAEIGLEEMSKAVARFSEAPGGE